MTGFARFIAIIFMVLGVVLILAGGGIAFAGFMGSPTPAPTAPFQIPNYSGLFHFAGLLAGGVLAFQGLLLAAIGQVLWLLARMTDKAELSIEYMAELVRRMGNANR